MRLTSSAAIAASALKTHKLRSFLASLGIMIGIGSVVVMVAIGRGSQKESMDIISRMGENLITVSAGEMKVRGGRLELEGSVNNITARDAQLLKEDVPELKRAAPYEYVQTQVKYKNSATEVRVAGSNLEFLPVRKYEIERGNFFEERDLKTANRVAVIGYTTIKNIFGDEDPIGQTVRVKSVPFKIIGVFKPKGMDTDGQDQDDVFLVPLNALLRRIMNQTYIRTIYYQVESKDKMKRAEREIRDWFRSKHRLREGQPDDFTIQSQVDIEKLKRETAETFTLLIVGVAAISLVVGGIGILAVMLISVRERTREIGMRRAVGASRTDIVQQFVMESVLIGLLGGAIGIAAGTGITLGLARWSPWTLILDYQAIVVSTLVCTAVGIVFGIYPAIKASRLDPMEALVVE
ncbi:MAG: ABC transporter permease [Nitrospinae bacterium]|nr:ABC transporter permease [Nitrospinota bacterium]